MFVCSAKHFSHCHSLFLILVGHKRLRLGRLSEQIIFLSLSLSPNASLFHASLGLSLFFFVYRICVSNLLELIFLSA